jgi:hypothetical protein
VKTKLLEVRDKATFVPVAATMIFAENPEQRYLLRRVGLGTPDSYQVHLMRLNDGTGHLDCYHWGHSRTMTVAHDHIEKHWHDLKDGDVVDVEFILGETVRPKVSERFELPDESLKL